MIKMEVIFDPANRAEPLQFRCLTAGINPALCIMLLSQIVTALSQSLISGNSQGLIIPAANLPKAPQ